MSLQAQQTSTRSLPSDEAKVKEAVLTVMRRNGDPDFYVFAETAEGLYMNRVGEVDPISHLPLQNPKSRYKIGGIKKPWSIF